MGVREQLGQTDRIFQMISVHNALAARIANEFRFDWLSVGGYGNYLNVIRLVREMQRAGASAIHIEDQVFPKKCGHFQGKRIVPEADFIAKIKAFVDTRTSDDFLLVARTDAIAVGGFSEAVDRSNAYLEAGGGGSFVEA